jgi:hypothetical protein
MAQQLRDNIQAYARGRVESEWEYHNAEQTDLQPLIYSTPSERKDDAIALSLYAVRFLRTRSCEENAHVLHQACDGVLDPHLQPSAIFQPRTLSNFIVLIMTILQDIPAPGASTCMQRPFLLNIDGPQATLLLWGGFASWAWQIWTFDTPHYYMIVKMVGQRQIKTAIWQ